MTTEIAVLNRLGVALATDSAVTITSAGRTKIFNTADKLFELSSIFPVAIMINGNMDCIGVPWEIVIKDFRKSNGELSRASIDLWLSDFVHFVENYPALDQKTADQYTNQIVDQEIMLIQRRIFQKFRDVAFTGGEKEPVTQATLMSKLFIEVLTERKIEIERLGRSKSLIELDQRDVIKKYRSMVVERASKSFSPFQLESFELEQLEELIAGIILAPELSDVTTGLVVSGFGSQSIFPEISAVEISGRVLDRLKVSDREPHALGSSDDSGRVVSFAQTDVIERLLGGADPQFVEKTAEFIELAVRDAANSIEEVCRPKRISKAEIARRRFAIDSIVEVLSREYKDTTAGALRKQFTREFDRMIAMMPKQELVELAEALVSITAVERKASVDEGTVGGPIDVALITKHDGFVWIKRKHYFKAHLNPSHFWRKYGSGHAGGSHDDNDQHAER